MLLIKENRMKRTSCLSICFQNWIYKFTISPFYDIYHFAASQFLYVSTETNAMEIFRIINSQFPCTLYKETSVLEPRCFPSKKQLQLSPDLRENPFHADSFNATENRVNRFCWYKRNPNIERKADISSSNSWTRETIITTSQKSRLH